MPAKLSPGFLLADRNIPGIMCEKCHAEIGSWVPKMALPRLIEKGISPHILHMGRDFEQKSWRLLEGPFIQDE